MKIGIDVRCLEEKEISGIGEYSVELVKNLLLVDKINGYALYSNSFRTGDYHLNHFRNFANARIKRLRYPNKILNLSIWYLGYPRIDRLIGDTDLLFALNINFISVSKNCPLITTFHDLSFERFPQFYRRKTRLWHKYFVAPRKLARKSKRIIAISNSTKNDLIDLYNIPERNIEVINHGIGKEYREINISDPQVIKIKEKYSLPEKFLLYLGKIESRKNIKSLFKAYIKLREQNANLGNYKLVLVGENNLRNSILKEIKKDPFGEDIHIIGYIPKEDKPYFYNLAALSIYPSYFEGFGLPLLESMACGTPVISSHTSSMPEVVSDAAILINPLKPAELTAAIKNLLENEDLHAKLRARGLKRANLFTWEKCAQKTLGIINQAAEAA